MGHLRLAPGWSDRAPPQLVFPPLSCLLGAMPGHHQPGVLLRLALTKAASTGPLAPALEHEIGINQVGRVLSPVHPARFNRWQIDTIDQLEIIRDDIDRAEARADDFAEVQDDLLIRLERLERSSGRMSLDIGNFIATRSHRSPNGRHCTIGWPVDVAAKWHRHPAGRRPRGRTQPPGRRGARMQGQVGRRAGEAFQEEERKQ